ncbi:hypothetical protein [Streptomyces sp. NPDC055099]
MPVGGTAPVGVPVPVDGPPPAEDPEGAWTERTGIRSTAPHAHPSSGWGHWPRRPHIRHRTVTHSSAHVRSVTGSTVAPRATGGTTGAPHAQG